MNNQIDLIIQYENGECNKEQTLELFSQLIKSGLAWKLQGHYGRTARSLIEQNFISKDGKVTQ